MVDEALARHGRIDGKLTSAFLTCKHVLPGMAERGTINGPVVVGGQLVRPGDLLLGDDDGLVALGPDIVRSRIDDALAKLAREAGWQESLLAGRTMAQTFGLAEVVAAGRES